MDARNPEGLVEVGAEVDGADGGAGAVVVDEGTVRAEVVDGAAVSVARGEHPVRASAHTIANAANNGEEVSRMHIIGSNRSSSSSATSTWRRRPPFDEPW